MRLLSVLSGVFVIESHFFIQNFTLSVTNQNKSISFTKRARCKACSDIIYLCILFTYRTKPTLTEQIRVVIWFCTDLLCQRTRCDSPHRRPQLLSAAVNQQITPYAPTLGLKVHSNKHNFCIRTNIDLFICLTGRDTRWSGYNNRWCCNRERKGAEGGESWCESYFRNAGEETYWSGHLDLIRTSGLRGARQSLSTPLAAVVRKKKYIYICCFASPPLPHTLLSPSFFFSILFGSFLPEVKKKISSPSG